MTVPIAGNKTAKSEQTKKRIIQTYLELMESKKWDKITVKELCTHADITRGTFYQYYSDIYEMMEQIQEGLLHDITKRYESLQKTPKNNFPIEAFLEKFDYEPPQMLLSWFDFCKDNKDSMRALLDSHNGDIYFEKKLKHILNDHINIMMDDDGLPHDELRTYFVKAMSELHFLAARLWLESEENEFLSVNEVVNLLNTMRVGAGYLSYKRNTTPDFEYGLELENPK